MKKLFTLSIILLGFDSCKKENPNIPCKNISSNNNFSTDYYNGKLDVCKSEIIRNDSLIDRPGFSFAEFSDTLVPSLYSGFGNYDVGNLSINNTWLKKDLNHTYYDTTYTQFTSPFNWSISGNGSISNFTFTNYSPYPSFPGYQNLPDSVNINNNLILNLSDLNNADRIEIYLQNMEDFSRYTNIAVIEKPITNVTFQSYELQQMYMEFPSERWVLHFRMYKNNFQKINGKIYNFRSCYYLSKINIHPFN